MRLLELFQKEDYQPLERGEAFPQFYENGDHHIWLNPWHLSWKFWYFLQGECRYYPSSISSRDEVNMLMMGGEL